MHPTRLLLSILAALPAAGPLPAQAAHPGHTDFAARLREADFVFEGRVQAVRYRMSVSRAVDEPSVPLTYVTFAIDHVFKGAPESESRSAFTLRHLGGPAPDGRILLVSHMPIFRVGDREVLLLRRDESGAGTMVAGSARRFRVIGNEVFHEDGHEVVLDTRGRLGRGERRPQAEFGDVRIGEHLIRRAREDGASSREKPRASRGGIRLDAGDLRRWIASMVERDAALDGARPEPVADCSPDEDFGIGNAGVAAPPEDTARAAPMDPAEAAERRLVEAARKR